jgi:hypothetical protein
VFDAQTLHVGPQVSELNMHVLAVVALYIGRLARTGGCPSRWIPNGSCTSSKLHDINSALLCSAAGGSPS